MKLITLSLILLLTTFNAHAGTNIIKFSGTVENGETFTKILPNKLAFQFIPIHAGGWVVKLINIYEPNLDYAMFNSPYHFRNALNFSLDYRTKAEEAVVKGSERNFDYVLDKNTYTKAFQELDSVLHPPADWKKDQENLALENLYQDIKFYKGIIKIIDAKISPSSITNPLGEIHSISFEVSLELPNQPIDQ